ncbi:hypothetical protein [Georgenia deserti]|uniref:STAS domain-containing protein n=1 Tax=Georgenia deserti TaxID=2093781 RepID=A0ABW4L7N3_9MICO
MRFTVRMVDEGGVPQVHIAGPLDLHTATEFTQLVHHLGEAVGHRACYDLSGVEVKDQAGRMAVRTFERDAAEYGGRVCPPAAPQST